MSCKEISADWAAQRIKGLVAEDAPSSNALCNSADARSTAKNGDGHQDADRHLPLSAQGPRHDVGSVRAAQVKAAGRRRSRWARNVDGLRWDDRAKRWTIGAINGDGECEGRSSAEHVISSAPMRELVGGIHAACPACEGAADTLRYRDFLTVALILKKRRPVRRQLDLHPRPEREGRPRPELQVVVARDGAGPEAGLLRPRVLLLRGRRPVELVRRGPDRAGQEGAGADRPRRRERRHGRLRGAPAEGVPGLRRRATRRTSRRSATSWPSASRPCTSSAATACTSTTTRTTP